MINRFIVFQNPQTNHIGVLIPCVNDMDEILKDIPKNQDGNTVEFMFIDKIPKYIETFDFKDNLVIRNRTKLHNFKKNQWRFIRKSKLEKLDIEFMKSIELGDTIKQDEIKLKKQALRDVTDTDCSNLSDDELENYTPDILQ
jgi:hypothetical protein